MRIEQFDNKIILIIKNKEVEDIDFDNPIKLEKYFKEKLLKLKDIYNIDIKGFYNIIIYLDYKEGIVIELEKEDIDYYDAFHQIEMRIIKEETTFLYEITDIFSIPYQSLDIYTYLDKIYAKRKEKEVLELYEFGKLIYKDTDKIIKNGNKMTILQ